MGALSARDGKSSLAQDTKVKRKRWAGDAKGLAQLANRHLATTKEVQNPSAGRIGDRAKYIW
jgi:hypothetical protein